MRCGRVDDKETIVNQTIAQGIRRFHIVVPGKAGVGRVPVTFSRVRFM